VVVEVVVEAGVPSAAVACGKDKPCGPLPKTPLRCFFLKYDLCHFGNHLSGSGGTAGL